MRQHFQFCTHDYPVYYISSTLQIRTPYASSENEKQEILVHLPRTPRKRKGKNVYLYATVHAVHARTNEWTQKSRKKGYYHVYARARHDYILDTLYFAVFATRGFDYTIPDEIIQNHSLQQQQQQHCIVYACTLWHTFTHTLLEIEVRCLIYYTFLAQQKKVWFQRIFSL